MSEGAGGSVSLETVYEWSRWRYALAMAAIAFGAAAAVWLIMSLVFSGLRGHLDLPPLSDAILFVSLYTATFAGFSVLSARRWPPRLAFRADGIELAPARRNAVLVPYPVVSGVQLGGTGPMATLQVWVAADDESQVVRLDRAGRRPPCRRKDGGVRYSMPIAGLKVSATTIRAELDRRGLVT